MRPTIVLLVPQERRNELLERLRRVGAYTPNTFFDTLEFDDHHFGVDLSGDVIGDYDKDELEAVTARVGPPYAVTIEYGDVESIRELCHRVLPDLQGVLDTNFDEFVDFRDVLARFTKDPGWDWRA